MSIKTSLELNLQDRLRRLNEIGVALSAERDLQKLLRLILLESRLFTRADAGTLYLVGNKVLTFEITQNDTLGKGVTYPPSTPRYKKRLWIRRIDGRNPQY
jgi:hypothetical protein